MAVLAVGLPGRYDGSALVWEAHVPIWPIWARLYALTSQIVRLVNFAIMTDSRPAARWRRENVLLQNRVEVLPQSECTCAWKGVYAITLVMAASTWP